MSFCAILFSQMKQYYWRCDQLCLRNKIVALHWWCRAIFLFRTPLTIQIHHHGHIIHKFTTSRKLIWGAWMCWRSLIYYEYLGANWLRLKGACCLAAIVEATILASCHVGKSLLLVIRWGTCSRADSRFAPSQWDTLLQSNAVSHWLGANLESALL